MNPRLFNFIGGRWGEWRVCSTTVITGAPLESVDRIAIVPGDGSPLPERRQWILRGVTGHERYVTRGERDALAAKQAPLGRPSSSRAALIPIRKSAAWWALTQDERRNILEEKSRHIATGLKYLPAIARRLHHCRDLIDPEPFDFLTLFDYSPADASAFDELVAALRATEEWKYVDREIDLRLERDA